MFYVSRGNVPHKRHTQHRAPNGSLYAEELFGMEGFTGRSSLLYHLVPPTRTHLIEPVEGVVVFILTTLYGATPTQAVAITLVDRFISVVSVIVFGGIAYVLSDKTKGPKVTPPPVTPAS